MIQNVSFLFFYKKKMYLCKKNMNGRKLLIVVDYQNDFITGALKNDEALKIKENLINKIKSWDGYIISTVDTHNSDYMNTQEGKKLPIPHCIRGTHGWEIEPDVLKALKNHVYYIGEFEKNCFGCINLMHINDKMYDEICLVGVCTDICVISNALLLKNCFPEMPISVDSTCCAGVTKESHENALNAMSSCQIKIIR